MSRSPATSVLGPLFLSALLGLCLNARAQHGGGGGGHGGMGGGMPGSGAPGFAGGGYDYGRPNSSPPRNAQDSAGSVSGLRGGLQLGPPGRWWDDKRFAKELKLRPDQQRRMDTIFEINRPSLTNRLITVLQEENRMEALVRLKNPEEPALNAQIDRVWQARAELEKARTHYLLQIRQEMDTDQLARLEEHRPTN